MSDNAKDLRRLAVVMLSENAEKCCALLINSAGEIERLRRELQERTDERNYLSRQLNKAEGRE